MHIGVYGSGYLGTVVSACLADFGNPVTCYDADSVRVYATAQGTIPYYEKNLKDVIRRNVRAGRLVYSTDLDSFAQKAQVIFVAEDSARYIEDIAVKIARSANPAGFLVVITPVPVGTATRLEQRLASIEKPMTLVSHPIFITDGCAVEDFNWPDRILLGTSSSEAVQVLKQIYRPLAMRGVPVIVTSHETAELAREAATAFVATKISFINELAALCEHVSADAVDLALALGLDKKIAPRCLQPGAGFGGTFVESDMDALAQLAQGQGISLKVLSAAREVNRSLTDRIVDKLNVVMQSLNNKEVGLLGLAFKPNTNSVAASSAINLAKSLMTKGARVRAYDPVAIPDARAELEKMPVRYCDSAYHAAEGSDALVVGTGWPEFRALDFERIKRLLRRPVIVDTKNLLDGSRMRAMGFQYVGMGRN
ncbi:MAG TPA: nucleotide sugar dehydrogenase [Terriglobales bacterium]|jgi:UDPglucose 6-dehydrogenase|nr:nucleotide sugar dehydrogenase [Terriglobales bacterium]